MWVWPCLSKTLLSKMGDSHIWAMGQFVSLYSIQLPEIKWKTWNMPKKKKKERERERWGEFNKLAQSPRISLWQSCVLNPCFLLPDLMFFPLRPTSLINHYGRNRKQSRAHVFVICSFWLQTLVTVHCSLPITFFLRNLHKYRCFAQLHCLFPEEMNLEARIDTVPDLQHTQVVKNTDLEPGRWGE